MLCDKCGRTVKLVYEYTWYNGIILNKMCYCDACVSKGMAPPRRQMQVLGGSVKIVHDPHTGPKTGPKPKEKK